MYNGFKVLFLPFLQISLLGNVFKMYTHVLIKVTFEGAGSIYT